MKLFSLIKVCFIGTMLSFSSAAMSSCPTGEVECPNDCCMDPNANLPCEEVCPNDTQDDKQAKDNE